jgi:hypothetical protein
LNAVSIHTRIDVLSSPLAAATGTSSKALRDSSTIPITGSTLPGEGRLDTQSASCASADRGIRRRLRRRLGQKSLRGNTCRRLAQCTNTCLRAPAPSRPDTGLVDLPCLFGHGPRFFRYHGLRSRSSTCGTEFSFNCTIISVQDQCVLEAWRVGGRLGDELMNQDH